MKIGLVTIGQAPRLDVVPEMRELLGPAVEVLEAGALDGMTLEEISTLRPHEGDYILTTRLRNGTEVLVAKRHIVPRVQQRIAELEQRGAEVVGLLCTGAFPDIASRRPLLRPQLLLCNLVRSMAFPGRIGVLTPSHEQRDQTRCKWQELGLDVVVEAASPYGDPDGLERAGQGLRQAQVALVVMDCIGYSEAMKAHVKTLTGAPVILAHALMARVMQELL
jgi:protein AroM